MYMLIVLWIIFYLLVSDGRSSRSKGAGGFGGFGLTGFGSGFSSSSFFDSPYALMLYMYMHVQ